MTDLSNYTPRPLPGAKVLRGRLVVLEPLDAEKYGAGLGNAVAGPGNDDIWTYMPFDPVENADDFINVFTALATKNDWLAYIITDAETGEVLGTASYMRQRPEHGSIEVGCVAYSKKLQRSAHASEAIYLMGHHIFDDLDYRRFEWKCHNENKKSRNAAARYGFKFEGVFRNDMVMKGKNRDTAWFAMTDDDWPDVKQAFERWLSPDNFDENGHQKRKLAELRA